MNGNGRQCKGTVREMRWDIAHSAGLYYDRRGLQMTTPTAMVAVWKGALGGFPPNSRALDDGPENSEPIVMTRIRILYLGCSLTSSAGVRCRVRGGE